MHSRLPLRHHALAITLVMLASPSVAALAQTQSVTTYHNDTLRTGWNAAETALTTANVGSGGFDLQATTALDSQVDAQPLVVPNQKINGQTARTVVYVATGGNTLYAIDGVTGAILASRSFGTPVPQSALPGRCSNNGPSVGITATPVISIPNATMYLIADTFESGHAVYRVHAVSLSTLQDKMPSRVITASTTLSDGKSYSFNADVTRLRAALLLSGNSLYAAFTSYCDQAQSTSRGWMLGWNTSALQPLPHNDLTDTVPTSQSSYFLNTIWMSGYGPSTASANNLIYVVTSNSDKNTYGASNRDESLLQVKADLSGVQGYFTDPKHASFDDTDEDFGSGGAMLLPAQPGKNPKLVLAAGKSGTMYMFDRDAPTGMEQLGTYPIGGCWCGPSYFQGSDGVGRVVSSGGSSAIVWRVNGSSSAPTSLTKLYSTSITTGQDGGFFTSLSSNGTNAGTAIIWAVGRPTGAPGTMPLYAIDPTSGKILYTATAGNWTNGNSNANIVPTVANGHVYVATNQKLAIFGLGSPAKAALRTSLLTPMQAGASRGTHGFALNTGEHAVWGIIQSVGPAEMVIARRNGLPVRIYLGTVRASGNLAEPVVGEATVAIGREVDGVLQAANVMHAKHSSTLWAADQ